MCWRKNCRLRFGLVVDGRAEIDPGFVLTSLGLDDAAVELATESPIKREYPTEKGLALGSKARHFYTQSVRDGSLGSFIAHGRHNKQPIVWRYEIAIECPEHGWQVISPEHLGAESWMGEKVDDDRSLRRFDQRPTPAYLRDPFVSEICRKLGISKDDLYREVGPSDDPNGVIRGIGRLGSD